MSEIERIKKVRNGEHVVYFYEADQALIESLVAFFVTGFEQGEVAIVVATRQHRAALEKKLADAGYDLPHLKNSGKYSPFDAAETLGLFMVNGWPDPRRFRALVGALLESASRRSVGVRAFGEMVSVLWAEGNITAAIELERLWNELAKTHTFTLLCGYRKDQFSEADKVHALPQVRAAHSQVIGEFTPIVAGSRLSQPA